MSEWKENNLEDLVYVDKEQLNSSIDGNYTFYYIDISSVSENSITFPPHPIIFKGSPSRARKVLHDGDLLMATVRPNLKAFAKFKMPGKANFIASTGFAVLSKKETANLDFIFHTLFSISVEKQIEALVVGSNYPALNTRDIKRLKISTPSITEQHKIASILSTVDSVIDKTQAAIAKYKAIRQGMLHDLFTRGIDIQTGKLRPKIEDAPELYKETKLGWVPKEWEVKIFGKEVDLVHGHQFRDFDFTEYGVPVVKIGQVKPENVDLMNCSFVGVDKVEEFKNEIIRNGDVLMALTGATLGKACIVSGLNKVVLQNYRVGRFEPIRDDDIDKTFLYYTLTEGKLLTQIFNKVNSGAQGNIGKADFEKAIFKKPPFEEQKQIAERMSSLNQKLQTEQNYLEKLYSIKSGLMEDLLSGMKRVKVVE